MVRKTLAAIAFSVFTVSSAHALMIEDFSTTLLLSDPGTNTGFVTAPTTSIIGGERQAGIAQLSGSDPATLAFNSGGSGTMSIGNGTGGMSTIGVVWDGTTAGGLGGIDLTVGGTQNAFDLRIVANDFAADISILVWDTSHTLSLLTLASPGGVPGPSSIPMLFEYANFSGSADFTSVRSIELGVNTLVNATDIEIDFLRTTTTEVAEPETLLILGLGLAGLGFARRRLR